MSAPIGVVPKNPIENKLITRPSMAGSVSR